MLLSPALMAALFFATACVVPVQRTPARSAPESAADASLGLTCGAERWPVKTMTDPDALRVDLIPHAATVTELRRLVAPPDLYRDERVKPVEFTTYVVRAVVSEFKLEDDRDIHVVIRTPDNSRETMIVELVDPECEGAIMSSQRKEMGSARSAFVAICGLPQAHFVQCPVELEVVGVAFFDVVHGQTGVAPNGIELHPVLGVALVGSPPDRTP